MNNIVKSVVFAMVVLFAGIAAMQVIYKNQDQKETKTPTDFHTQTVLETTEPKNIINVCAEMTNAAYEAYSHCTYTAMAEGSTEKMADCKAVFAAFKRNNEEICPSSN